jgi:hypothetical protein
LHTAKTGAEKWAAMKSFSSYFAGSLAVESGVFVAKKGLD